MIDRHDARAGLLVVFVVAALVRVWVGLQAQDAPYWTGPVVDEIAYMQMSERMVLGQDPPHGAYYMTPGYGWFLAALLGLGAQLPLIKWIQLGLGVLNAVLVAGLARRFFDGRVAVLAGVLWALTPITLLHEVLILKPTVTLTLALSGLLAISAPRAGWIRWTLGGLALGAATVVRGEMLLVALALVGTAIVLARRGSEHGPASWRAPLAGLAMIAVVVAIPTVQNVTRGGGPVLIAFSGGPNFYIGNHEGADGSYLPLRPGRSDATVEADDAVQIARENSTRALDAAGVSRFWFGEGLRWWREHPGDALGLTAKKALLLLGAWEGNDVHSLPIAGRWITALNNPVLRSGVIFPLAIAGLVFLGGRLRRWPMLVFLVASWLSLLPFFVFERFRIPMLAVATILAAAAVVHAFDRWRSGGRAAVAAATLGTLALGLLLTVPRVARDESVLHVNVGSMLLQQGRFEEALAEFDVVRRLSPSAKRVEINRATALRQLGRDEDALRALDVALQALYAEARGTGRPPMEELGYCHETAGDIHAAANRPREAARHYQAILRLAPDHGRVQAKLRRLDLPESPPGP